MEVNRITFSLYKILLSKGWTYLREHDEKYVYLTPNRRLGFSEDFKLQLPISSRSHDFYKYFKGILTFLKELYPNNSRITHLELLNERMKNRYLEKWILPEERSRISKIKSTEIYLPKK